MTKFFCVIIVILATSVCTLSATEPFSGSVLRNLLLRIKNQPQEKVYLQTDREHYTAGERVWFRAYLSDALTHKPSPHSRYVYVELVDRKNKVWQRVKIRGVDSVYSGYIPVPKMLPQGECFLRAYSYYMQNAGEDYIFKKKIRVINIKDSKVYTNMRYYGEKEEAGLEIQFTNLHKQVYSNAFVEYTIRGKSGTQHTDENGIIRIPQQELEGSSESRLKVNTLATLYKEPGEFPKTRKETMKISVRFKNDIPVEFERELYLPVQLCDFDLQFFPEGGDLIAGCTQNVAFKAIGSDGFAKEIEGCVYNEQNECVATIKSIHKGMGVFNFKPEAGQRYHAVVTSVDSIQKKIDLPLPKREGIALKVWMKDPTLNYLILAGDSVRLPDSLYLMVLSRGTPIDCIPVEKMGGRLPLKMLPEGIVHLVLVGSDYQIYSQRLCFARKKNRPELSLEADKESYVIRDLVRMTVDVPGEPGQELNGSFSVSVTDDMQCKRDSINENHILSYLLLTSDLKGYIEDPAFYFRNPNPDTDQKLDLLMLTQGWSRFKLPEAIRGKLPDQPYYLEKGQVISGKVKNYWDNEAINAKITAFSLSGKLWTTQADSSGNFTIDGMVFHNNTEFIIRATSKKGARTVELIVDRESFQPPFFQFPYKFEIAEKEDDLDKKFVKNYYYDNGMKVYILDEVVVKPKSKKNYSLYQKLVSDALDSAQLASMAGWDMDQVLEQLPNVWVDKEARAIRRGQSPLLLLVNGEKGTDFDIIMSLKPTDFLYIGYLNETHTKAYLSKNSNGALIFTTSPNLVRDGRTPRLNVALVSFLGYQKEAKFYTPRYDVDSVRQALVKETDDRPTIYWNPNIRTNQSGKAEFSFYTSDSYGPYTVTVEGVLNDGTVYRKERKVSVKLQ